MPRVKLAFDEWGVWDELVGTPENGLQQPYDLKDALAFGAWLNVFIRQSASIGLACLAQAVNVIAPLNTRATGVLRHPTYHVLRLFSQHMRGTAVRVSLGGSAPTHGGVTLPEWAGRVRGAVDVLDASAVLVEKDGARNLRIAVVNRSSDNDLTVPLRVAFETPAKQYTVHEVWHADAWARNEWDNPENVAIKTLEAEWTGSHTFKAHSFTLLELAL